MSASEKTSKAKKIYNIVTTVVIAIIFIALVVMVSVLLWQRKSGGDSSLFGYYMFDVVTDSMKGTIEPGEIIISKEVDDPSQLKVGDIITFVAPSGQLKGYNVTHRIVEVVSEDGKVSYFRTKGDNPDVGVDDWRLDPDSVKAKFVKKSSFIAGLRDLLSHWYGYVVLIALPLTVAGALIIAGYVRGRVAEERAKQKQNTIKVENLSEEDRQKLLEEAVRLQNADASQDTGIKSDGEE